MLKPGRKKAEYSIKLDDIIKEKYLSAFVSEENSFFIPQRKNELYEKLSDELKACGYEILPENIFHALHRRQAEIRLLCSLQSHPSR